MKKKQKINVIFEGDAEKWREKLTSALFDITLQKFKKGEIDLEKVKESSLAYDEKNL